MRDIKISINNEGYVTAYEKFIANQFENEATRLIFDLPKSYCNDNFKNYVVFRLSNDEIVIRKINDTSYDCIIDRDVTKVSGVCLFQTITKKITSADDLADGVVMASQPISGYIKEATYYKEDIKNFNIDANIKIYLDEFDALLAEMRNANTNVEDNLTKYTSIITKLTDDLNERIAKITNNNANDMSEVIDARGNFTNLGLRLDKKPYYFATVDDMKMANLKAGSCVVTNGYYDVSDGGGAYYIIRENDNASVDGSFTHSLTNGLVAELIIMDKVNIKQLGAKADNTSSADTFINLSLSKLGYAYLTSGLYKIENTIILGRLQTIYGDNYNDTIINYDGTGNCIQNKNVQDCIEVSVHDLSLIGNSKKGNGIYLFRDSKLGDAYHRIYNLKISNFENGLYAGQYQNETKFNNLYITKCKCGIYFDKLNDCYVSDTVSCINDADGLLINGSSELRISNFKAWYNGMSDTANSSNITIKVSGAINMNNITSQESYGHNMILYYNKNIMITNCYLSWSGLGGDANNYQIYVEENVNCKVDATTQNGHYGLDTYDNYILGIKNHPYCCDFDIKVESDFPKKNKIIILGSNNNLNGVFLRNNINIQVDTLNYNKINYAKNGNLVNKSDLSFVNNNSHCKWLDGKLQISSVGESDNVFIYFKTSKLPRQDFYTTYAKIKKISGNGNFIFDNPAYANIKDSDDVNTEYVISYTKYVENIDSYIIVGILQPDVVIEMLEFGIVLGESCKLDTPMDINAII